MLKTVKLFISPNFVKIKNSIFLGPLNLSFFKFYPLLILIFFTHKSYSQSDQQIKDIAKSKEWTRLLYYQKNNSEVDSPKFFLNPKGKSNPEAELRSSLKLFFEEFEGNEGMEDIKDMDELSICKFPARFYLLTKKIHPTELSSQLNRLSKCTKLNNFLARLQGQSVSLIFSSYFINNPSSAFGHTFIKINKDENQNLDLLNYGINYAATTETQNGAVFAFKGLVGLFRGEFTAVPYYYKVREYNDFQSRDLWEYQLNFSTKETFFLTLHIWELGQASSWYYFLNKNCSYWAIRVLEAIRPQLNISNQFSKLFIIPIETVKNLFQAKGLVKNIKYRPSLRQQLLNKTKDLKHSQAKQLKKIVNDLNSNLSSEKDFIQYTPDFLESVLLLYDYTNAKNFVVNEKKLLQQKQPLLLARSQMTASNPNKIEFSLDNAPHTSHPDQRLSVGYKEQCFKNLNQKLGLNLRYKQGLHDILDSSQGFNPNMSINYFDFSFLLFKEKNVITESSSNPKFILDYFYLLNVDAFLPIKIFESNLSWRLKMGLDSEQFFNDWNHKVGFFTFDTGVSKAFLKRQNLLVYFLISNTFESSGRFENSVRYGIAPLLGLKIGFTANKNLMLEAKPVWVYDFSNDPDYVAQTSLKFQNYVPSLKMSLSIDGNYFKSDTLNGFNLSIGLNAYF